MPPRNSRPNRFSSPRLPSGRRRVPQPHLIIRMAARPFQACNLRSRPRGGLSGTFQENVGSDVRVVFDGPFTFTTAASGPPGGPTDFDIVVDIDDFLYDPRLGNLLLDVSKEPFHWGTNFISFDAQWADLESGAPVLTSRAYNWDDGTSPFALNTDNIGLVTQFSLVGTNAAPTPEPASIVLFGSAAAGLFGAQRWRR